MTDPTAALRAALGGLLREALEGPPDAAYFLNRGDRGLLASLDVLPAEAASARPDGRPSVAAHVDHLRYGLSLLNRWARGEDPWPDANFAASWKRQAVSAEEWAALKQAFAAEAAAWAEAIGRRTDWSPESMAEIAGSVVHLAYHLGAIRQLARGAAGPTARD